MPRLLAEPGRGPPVPPTWDGHAAERIADVLEGNPARALAAVAGDAS